MRLDLVAEIAAQPLAIMPQKLDAIVQFLHVRGAGIRYSDTDIEARIGGTPQARANSHVMAGRDTAIIPVMGVIGQRLNMVQNLSSGGGTSTEMVGAALREMDADQQIQRVVLDISSPGGSVYGTPELAAIIGQIARAGRTKITAQVNSLAASAAYWIASQANEIVITPSGEVGSVGVYTIHNDLSGKAAMEGIARTYISAGKYKVAGHPFSALDEEARAALQGRVNEIYGQFVQAVATGRSRALGRNITAAMVRGGFGEGRVVGAVEAVKLGMADRIGTLDDTVRRPTGAASRSRSALLAAAEDSVLLDTMKAANEADRPILSRTTGRRLTGAALARERRLRELERG